MGRLRQFVGSARGRRWSIEAGVAALYLAAALGLSYPWITHPATSTLGHHEAAMGAMGPDMMLPMTLAGWLRFAPAELGAWPLARSRWLMWPVGASHGDSFDGLLHAGATALLSFAMPLPQAQALVIVIGLVLTGWVTWRLGRRLWGGAWTALALGLVAEASPYVMQRFWCHPNLFHVWVIPVAMLAFERFRERPGAGRAAAWGMTFPLLALGSWYLLIAGLAFQAAALAALVGHAAARRGANWRQAGWGLAAWVLGLALTAVVAAPMLGSLGHRREIPPGELIPFSAPLAQYLMPMPGSALGSLTPVAEAQAKLGTQWEAQVAVPLPLTLLALGWFFARGRSVMKTALIGAAVLGVMLTLGPVLHVTRIGAPEAGLRLPLYFLIELWPGFGVVRAPGRMQPVVFFAALAAAGIALEWLLSRPRRPWARAALKTALLPAIVGICLAWSISLRPAPVIANPEVPAFYREIAAGGSEGVPGAVFDVPFSWYWFPHYNYYQLTHRRPAVSSVLFHDAASPEALGMIRAKRPHLMFFHDGSPQAMNEENVARMARLETLDELAGMGIEYVVVHPRFLNFLMAQKSLPRNAGEYYYRVEEGWRERKVYDDGSVRAYRTRAD